jgi:hypothetical protein
MSLSISFKRTYTSQVYQITIDTNFTIRQFLEVSKNCLTQFTGLPDYKIEVIESGQIRQEDDVELIPSNDLFIEKYSRSIPSFYFRPKINLVTVNENCAVCLDESPRQMLQTDCSHCLCSRCYNQMFERGIRLCPLCRSQTII